ncbi:MAG: carbohydrate ABC transporter permease [Clostridiales bacterium]|nr:carbohydrate ABC transporter permease [Clostridiales bacterium]
MIKSTLGDRIFNAINLTLITILMLVVLYPLILIVSSSFSDANLVSTGQVWLLPKGFHIDGYKRVFSDPDIMIGYRNSIFYTTAGTAVNLAVTLLAGYALSRRDLVGRNVLMFMMLFTMYFGGGMIPTYIIVRNLNLLNTWWVLIVTSAISTYNLIICRTFFINGVPRELEEAAEIDGCSQARTFFTIVLPLSKALIGVMTLYYGVGHWNSWFSAMIYLTDRSKVPLQLILRELLIENQTAAQMIEVDAYGGDSLIDKIKLAELIKYCVIVVASVPVMVVYPFIQKYFDKGVMLGSIKG